MDEALRGSCMKGNTPGGSGLPPGVISLHAFVLPF